MDFRFPKTYLHEKPGDVFVYFFFPQTMPTAARYPVAFQHPSHSLLLSHEANSLTSLDRFRHSEAFGNLFERLTGSMVGVALPRGQRLLPVGSDGVSRQPNCCTAFMAPVPSAHSPQLKILLFTLNCSIHSCAPQCTQTSAFLSQATHPSLMCAHSNSKWLMNIQYEGGLGQFHWPTVTC